jgi:hypothetical protein
MPQQKVVTIDGLAGADHVFQPFGAPNGVFTWSKNGEYPVGDEKLTITTTRPTTGRHKWTLRLALPKIQEIEGAGGVARPVVARVGYLTIIVDTDATALEETERGELIDMARSVLDNNSGANRDTITESLVYSRPFF